MSKDDFSIFDSLNLNFVISNPRAVDNPIVYASQGFYDLTGYSPDEVLGHNCRFLQGKGTSKVGVSKIRDAVREERPVCVTLLNYKKDKSPFFNTLYIHPVKNKDVTVWYIGIQADTTRLVECSVPTDDVAAHEAVQAEDIQQKIEDIALTAPSTACFADNSIPSSLLTAITKLSECFVLSDPRLPDNPMVYVSPAFIRLTGYSCEELLGKNCRLLQGKDTDDQEIQKIRNAIHSEPPGSVSVCLLNYKKDGTAFWNNVHISPIRDAQGGVQFFAGVQSDMTDRSNASADHIVTDTIPVMKEPTYWEVLKQKGVVGAVRVATRGMAKHGLRRSTEFQSL